MLIGILVGLSTIIGPMALGVLIFLLIVCFFR